MGQWLGERSSKASNRMVSSKEAVGLSDGLRSAATEGDGSMWCGVDVGLGEEKPEYG